MSPRRVGGVVERARYSSPSAACSSAWLAEHLVERGHVARAADDAHAPRGRRAGAATSAELVEHRVGQWRRPRRPPRPTSAAAWPAAGPGRRGTPAAAGRPGRAAPAAGRPRRGRCAEPPTSTATAQPLCGLHPHASSMGPTVRLGSLTAAVSVGRPSTARCGGCLVSDGSSGRAQGVVHMPNVDGGSLWELVERRAEATPDGLAAVDEDGRTLTWAEAKTAAERAAAGLARHGIGAGDVVSWQLPDLAREQGPRARPGPPRRHPEPDAPDLPRARGRLHHPPGQEQAARRAVDVGRLRLRGDGQGHRRRRSRTRAARSRCSWPTRPCPQGDPSTLPPPPDPERRTPSAGTSTRRAPRPTRRARSTPTAPSSPAPSA